MIDYCMSVAICDDDPSDRDMIEERVREIAEKEGIRCELTCYESSTALLEAIRSGAQYHTLLLDVMMPEMTGMELAAALRTRQEEAAIVFISSNREMALYGYEVAATRFLAKPVEEGKLREALLHCYRSGLCKAEITLPTPRGTRRLHLSEIICAETWGRGLRLRLTEGEEEVNLRISELEKMLPQRQFVLCHRAVLVNLAYVRYIRYCELELKTGGVLPVSKYRLNATREKLMNYLAD